MRSEVGLAFDEAREELAQEAADVLPDTCRLIVGVAEYEDTPCKLKGGGSNTDGAPYRIRFAWGSPAVVGAAAIIDAITGRSQLTLQLVAPVDSSTSIWQEWQATAGPAYGRADVGL
jgi:hypothetical protein